MAKIVLIHGYGAGIRLSRGNWSDLGFGAFGRLIAKKEATVFPWYQETNIFFLNFLNAFLHLKTYNLEKRLALKNELHQKLANFLDSENPQTIVCHSMGCFLLLQFLNGHHLPVSVRNVVFVQADVKRDFAIHSEYAVKFYNYYCFWDPSLIVSFFLNRYLPAGLVGTSNKRVINKFFPLYNHLNLHLSSISNYSFLEEILRL